MQDTFTTIAPDEARKYLQSRNPGEQTVLDVREDWEYAEAHLPGALHIPLSQLADRLGEVPRDRPVLAYCRSGHRSGAASGLLAGQGFAPVLNLMGGMNAWEGAAAAGPAPTGLAVFPADTSLERIIALACRMEVNLGAFYTAMADKAGDADTADTLRKLAGFEDRHKTMLLIIHRRLAGRDLDPAFLESRLDGGDKPLEGGLTAEEFMKRNPALLNSPVNVVETGMMFEAQALDLYMRHAREVDDAEARDLLLRLAGEEKAHLKALAELLRRVGN
ncbi:rhodanese-like domain-containing protein [Desulfocurvus sp. DL9XJH121]